MTKEELIQELIGSGCLKTPHLIEAFRLVDRRDFVPKEFSQEAYGNYPLPIGYGQTISQPLTVAFMLELLEPAPGQKILEIGAGSGWVTALLSYLVAPHGRVVAIERIPELQAMAEENVKRYGYTEAGIANVILGDGTRGYPKEAPFDRVTAAATADHILVAWKEQVRVGGRIVAPVRNTIQVLDKFSDADFNMKEYHGFSFVPLVTREGGNGGG